VYAQRDSREVQRGRTRALCRTQAGEWAMKSDRNSRRNRAEIGTRYDLRPACAHAVAPEDSIAALHARRKARSASPGNLRCASAWTSAFLRGAPGSVLINSWSHRLHCVSVRWLDLGGLGDRTVLVVEDFSCVSRRSPGCPCCPACSPSQIRSTSSTLSRMSGGRVHGRGPIRCLAANFLSSATVISRKSSSCLIRTSPSRAAKYNWYSAASREATPGALSTKYSRIFSGRSQRRRYVICTRSQWCCSQEGRARRAGANKPAFGGQT
jgi:hypothetical protein